MTEHTIHQTPDEFGQAVAQALAAQPNIDIMSVDDLTLVLHINRRAVTNDLTAFYQVYRSSPQQLLLVLQRLIETLVDVPPARNEQDPEVLLDRAMPMLKSLSLLSEIHERQLPMLAYHP
jgi:hypothetical protein